VSSKLILDQDAINENDFEGSRILGISAPIKNYQFCILLNQYMGFEFRIDDEKVNDILQTVRDIKGVQMVAELTPDQIKNKGHLIFE
jgi:hypothetical protein